MSLEQVLERSRELSRADRDSENLALLRDALAQYPGESEVALRAAVACFVDDDAEETERLARHAVSLSPEDPAVLMRAASMMLHLERTDEALELSGRARDHADLDFPLLFDLVHLVGQIALVRGEYEKAEPLLRLAFDNQPESLGHGRLLAMLLESQGRHEEGLEVAEEALRHWPGDRKLAHVGGRVAFGYGEEDRALELLQLAFDNEPEAPGYGLVLADVLERRGEHERALEVLEEAFTHRPADREVDGRRVYLRVALHGPDALPPGYTLSTE